MYDSDYKKGKAMFNEWKQKAGNNATKENLKKALEKVGIEISLPL